MERDDLNIAVTYDQTADAVRIDFADQVKLERTRTVNDDLYLILDEENEISGIEILGVSDYFSPETIEVIRYLDSQLRRPYRGDLW